MQTNRKIINKSARLTFSITILANLILFMLIHSAIGANSISSVTVSGNSSINGQFEYDEKSCDSVPHSQLLNEPPFFLTKPLDSSCIQFETRCGPRYISDPNSILFNAEGEFSPKRANREADSKSFENGCRLVGFTNGLCFKQWPELPGIERAIQMFIHQLFGRGTSWSEVIMRKRPGGINEIFLVSNEIEGVGMDRAISETLYKLDSERLSELIIASILTNPEDGRGSNIIVADCSSDNPYAVTIDNDHSLGPAEYLKTGDKSTCLRSVLFDLPQMGDPLHENVRKRLMELDPCEFLKEWLTDLKNEDEYQRNLMLDPSSIGIYSANKTLLGILLSRQSLENIQRKFLGIRFYLKTENMLTHKELVFALEPSIRNRFIKKYYEYAGYDDHGKTAMSGHDLIEKAHEEFYLNIDEALDRLKNFCRFYHIYFHNFKLIDREQNKLNNIKRIRVVKRSDSAYAAHNPPPWFPRNELFFCEESNLLEYIGEDEDKKEKIESLCKDFKDTDSVISDTCHQTQNSQTTTWLSLILPQNRLAELNICGRLDEKAISLLMISWEGPNSIAATNFLSALDPTKLTTLIMCGRLDEKAISLLCNILSSPDYKLTKLGLFVNHETPGVVVVFDSSHDPLCGDYAVYSYFRRKDATLHHDKDDRTAINSRFIDALCEPHCSVTTLSFRDSQFFEHKFPFHCLHKTKLTTLDYSYSCISESDVEDLADALMNPNCHLTSLNLSHNGIKKLSSCLFDALSSPKCRLTSLNLSHNSIEDKDAESLFEILPRTKRVKLVLSDNKISDDYMRKIRERLMCNAMQKEKCNEPTDSPCTVS